VSPTPLRLGNGGQLRIRFFVTGAATVEIQILRGGKVIKSFSPRELDAAGWVDARWNGKNRRGRLVHRGRYTVVVRARNELDGSEASLQLRVLQ
jgi:flagellar hook assembly protein FlgD